MKNIKNKFIATLMSVLMMVSIMPAMIFADGETTENVAKIGTTEYATLQGAYDAMQPTDTIVLLKDIDLGMSYMQIRKSGVLDLNGHTIESNVGSDGVLYIYNGNSAEYTFTISDNSEGKTGAVINTTTGTGNFAVAVEIYDTKSTVVINGGKYIANEGKNKSLYVNNSATTINGGVIENGFNDNMSHAPAFGNGVKIKGYDKLFSALGDTQTWVLDENGYMTVVNYDGSEGQPFAKINTTNYRSLAEAVTASANGNTITILRDGCMEDVYLPVGVALDATGTDYEGNVAPKESATSKIVKNGSVYTCEAIGESEATAKLVKTGGATTYYATVSTAANAAESGDTITVMKDASGYNNNASLKLGVKLVVGNGVSYTGTVSAQDAVANTIVKNGSVYTCEVVSESNATAKLEKTGGATTYYATVSTAANAAESGDTITVMKDASGYNNNASLKLGVKLVVADGVNYTGTVSANDSSNVINHSGNVYTCVAVSEENATASVKDGDNTYYFSNVNAAIKKAQTISGGGTVVMLKDATEQVSVGSGTVTLDLAGKTLSSTDTYIADNTGTVLLNANAVLTIIDSSDNKNGKISNTTGYAITACDKTASLTVKGGTIEGFKYGIHFYRGTKECSLESGIIKGGTNSIYLKGGYSNPSNVSVSGGCYSGSIYNYSKSFNTLEISGGCFTSQPDSDYIKSGYEVKSISVTIDSVNYTYIVGKDVTVDNGKVTGGTFDFDPSKCLAEGFAATENEGVWTVGNDKPAPETPAVTPLTPTEDTEKGITQEVIAAVTGNEAVNNFTETKLSDAVTGIEGGNLSIKFALTNAKGTQDNDATLTYDVKPYNGENVIPNNNLNGNPITIRLPLTGKFNTMKMVRITHRSQGHPDEVFYASVSTEGKYVEISLKYFSDVVIDGTDIDDNDVAAIGTTGYETLEEALTAATAGGTIELLENVELSNTLAINKVLTINGNGKEIKASNTFDVNAKNLIEGTANLTLNNVILDANEKARVIKISSGKLEITDVTIENGKAKDYAGGIFMTGASELVMNSGTVTGNVNTAHTDDYLNYSSDLWIGSQAKGEIKGGTVGNAFVNSNEYANPSCGLTMSDGTVTNIFVEWEGSNKATFTKSGGSVSKVIVANDNNDPHTAEFVETENAENGTYTAIEPTPVAQIGTTKYYTLQEAFTAATGGTAANPVVIEVLVSELTGPANNSSGKVASDDISKRIVVTTDKEWYKTTRTNTAGWPVIPEYVTLKEAEGVDCTIKGTLELNGAQHFTVDGFTFDIGSAGKAYRYYNNNDVIIENNNAVACIVDNGIISQRGASYFTVKNSAFTGITPKNVPCFAIAVDEQGRTGGRAHSWTISNCTFNFDAAYHYLQLYYLCDSVQNSETIITGNAFKASQYGFQCALSATELYGKLTFTNNTVEGNYIEGVVLGTGGYSSPNSATLTITGNSFACPMTSQSYQYSCDIAFNQCNSSSTLNGIGFYPAGVTVNAKGSTEELNPAVALDLMAKNTGLTSRAQCNTRSNNSWMLIKTNKAVILKNGKSIAFSNGQVLMDRVNISSLSGSVNAANGLGADTIWLNQDSEENFNFTDLNNPGNVTFFVPTGVNYTGTINVPTGKKLVETAVDNGKEYTAEDISYVAQITVGETTTKYETLAEAVAAATAGQTITLIDNIPQPTSDVFLYFKDNVTLDLNGKTITSGVADEDCDYDYEDGTAYIYEGKSLTIKNGTMTGVEGSGATEKYAYGAYVGNHNDTKDDYETNSVKIENVTFTNGGLNLYKAGAVTIENCNVTVGENNKYYSVYAEESTVTINGGTYGAGTNGNVIYADNKCIVTIKDGKFTGNLLKQNVDTAVFSVEGGIYSQKPAETYVADGKYVMANTASATKADYPWTVGEAVASITKNNVTTYYETLQAALDAAIDGDKIIVLKDCNIGVVTIDKAITIEGKNLGTEEVPVYPVLTGTGYATGHDGYGKSGLIVNLGTQTEACDVTIKNLNLIEIGNKAAIYLHRANSSNVNITIDGVSIEKTCRHGITCEGGTFDINHCYIDTQYFKTETRNGITLDGETTPGYVVTGKIRNTTITNATDEGTKWTSAAVASFANVDVDIDGCTFVNCEDGIGTSTYKADPITIDITNTTIEANNTCIKAQDYYEGHITVNLGEGNDFCAEAGALYAVRFDEDSTVVVNVTDGEYVSEGDCAVFYYGAVLNVEGGTLTAIATEAGDAGNDAIYLNSGSVANITGGVINGGDNAVFHAYDDGSAIYASAGKMKGELIADGTNSIIELSGGHYSSKPEADYIVAGKCAIEDTPEYKALGYDWTIGVAPVAPSVDEEAKQESEKEVNVPTGADDGLAGKVVEEVISEISGNTAVSGDEATNIQSSEVETALKGVIDKESTSLVDKTSQLKITVKSVASSTTVTKVSAVEATTVTTTKAKYDVKPYVTIETTTETGTTTETRQITNKELQEAGVSIAFRLAVPESMKGNEVLVKHYPEGAAAPDWSKTYAVQGEGNNRYVALEANSFSVYEIADYSTTDYVALNVNTNTPYAVLAESLSAATSGQTVILLKDLKGGTKVNGAVEVKPGVTFDLNGHDLEASYAIVFGDIKNCEGSAKGKLIVPQNGLAYMGGKEINIANTKDYVLPVWDSNGYVFCKADYLVREWQYGLGDATTHNPKFRFQPQSQEIQKILAEGSGVKVFVEFNYTKSEYNDESKKYENHDYHLIVEFGRSYLTQFLTNPTDYVMYVSLLGTENVTQITARAYLTANGNFIAASNPLTTPSSN